MPGNTAMPKTPFECELKHGIRLSIDNAAKGSLPGVADFLATAIGHFKKERDELKTQLYAGGPYRGYLVKGRRIIGNCTLSHPGDASGKYLTADEWTTSVINAYTNADTLQQMIQELQAYKAGASGWVSEVLELLDKPNGEFLALAAMIRR